MMQARFRSIGGNRPRGSLWRGVLAFLAAAVLLAVQFNPVAALFTNGGFEAGTLDNWTVTSYTSSSLTNNAGAYSLNLTPGGTNKTSVVGGPAVEPMTQSDSHSTIKYPRFGRYSAVVNYEGGSNNANSLKQTTTITGTDIDPVDGKAHVRFAYAPVLENPGHSDVQQPYFYIKLRNVSKNITLAERFAFAGQDGVPWQGTSVLYTDWQIVDIALTDEQWDDGDSIELEVIAAGCSQGGHYGYVYVDAFGSFLPGMSVSALGPATISRGQTIEYTYNWANTGNTTVNNVVLTAVAPAHTTYASNDSGCSHSSGTVTCNLGDKAAGVSGSVKISYTVSPSASGEIAHGNYQIAGQGFPPIIGPLVTTTVNPNSPPTGFSSGAPSGGTYGQNYSHLFSADGVPAPTFAVSSGVLPPGLTFSAATGALSGTPSAAGTYNFSVRAVNEAGSFTAPYSITIGKAATESQVTASVTSPVYGQPLHLVASIGMASPNLYSPSGKVQFYIDGSEFGPEVDVSGGTATSQSTSLLAAGEHIYSAVYLGDGNTLGSTAQSGQVEISQNQTTITVVSSDSTSVYGQPLQLTAAVAEVAPSVVTPTGQVQFKVNGDNLGEPVDLDPSGTAVSADLHTLLSGGHLLAGGHTFSAEYLGNSNSIPSASGVKNQQVDEAPTTVAVVSDQNPSVYGLSLNVTIQVSANDPSILVPDGSVQLSIDGVPFGPVLALDANGEARRTIPYLNLWPGDHKISASYTPGAIAERPAQFLPSNNHLSQALNQRVDRATPDIEITPSVQTPAAFQPVSYTVTLVQELETQSTPTGTVQFYVDGAKLGSAVQLDESGTASSPVTDRLAAGDDHIIYVEYSGDDYFVNIPHSNEITQEVLQAGAEARILSIDPAEAVVGQPVTVRVQVSEQQPSTGKPDGTVIVSNGVDACTAPLDGAGTGSCALEPSSPGNLSLVAAYSGSADFHSHESDPFAGPVVSKADIALGISHFDPPHPVTGQETSIHFTVAPAAPGWGIPAGEVTLSDGTGKTCSAPVSAGSCKLTFDQSGQTYLDITYSGDSNFNEAGLEAVSGPLVEKASTTTSLVSSAAGTVFGHPVTFTASVSVSAPGAGLPEGQIQFLIDGEHLGEPVEIVSGEAASSPIAGLAVGEHTVQALYSGDANFAASNSPSLAQDISKAGTVLVLESNLNPSPYGLPVMITASLSGSAPSEAIPAGGSVQFIVDGVPFGAPVPVNPDGQARKLLPFTALWIGAHQVQATYSGNESFEEIATPSGALSQIVEKGRLSITLEPNVLDPVFGQELSFTATVSGEGANYPRPTGSVQFLVDGEDLGSAVSLNEHSTALSQPISSLAVGAHTLELVYSGDDNYQTATLSLPSGLYVERAPAVVALSSSSPAQVVVGEPVAFFFDVSAGAPGAGLPSGAVTVEFGEAQCSGEVSAGSCSLVPTRTAAPGATVTLRYEGDENFLPAELSLAEGPQVEPAAVEVDITGTSGSPVVTGQPYRVSVQVTPVAPGTLIPTGSSITISNGKDFCTAVVQEDGSAQCEITPTSAGEQVLTASLEGGENFTDQTSLQSQEAQVNPAEVAVALSSSVNPVVNGAPVRFTASVQTLAPGSGVPGGRVQFMLDGQKLGDPVELAAGVAASPEVRDLAAGLHTVTAVYLGDGNYSGAQSAPFSQNTVLGDQGVVVAPDEDTVLILEDQQDGSPVEIKVEIPAGSVQEEVTLVLRKLDQSSLVPPEGNDFLMNFVIEAYQEGVLQPEIEFLQPLTVTLSYNPKNWKESSLNVFVWNGSEWSSDGIEIVALDPEANTITFTLTGAGASQISLAGTRLYYMNLPLVRLGSG